MHNFLAILVAIFTNNQKRASSLSTHLSVCFPEFLSVGFYFKNFVKVTSHG